MEIAFNRDSGIIKGIEKIFLTKEERAALQSIIKLPQDLRLLVRDDTVLLNREEFNFDITEEGYWHGNQRYPIVWLNSPRSCRRHLEENPENQLRLVFRKPKLRTAINYDFSRVLISKAYQD